MGRHEAPSVAPEEGAVLHIPPDVVEEARAEIQSRVAEYLRVNPVRVYRAVNGVSYTWTFDRLSLHAVSFGDQTAIVRESR